MADPMVQLADLTAFVSGDEQAAIDRVTAEIRTECGWHVSPALTETLTARTVGGRSLFIRSLFVSDVAAVRDPDGNVVDPTLYEWLSSGALVRLTGCWDVGVHEVDVTHGYATTPEDLGAVILARAARLVDDPKGILARVQKGPFAEQYRDTAAVVIAEASTIAAYRIPRSR